MVDDFREEYVSNILSQILLALKNYLEAHPQG